MQNQIIDLIVIIARKIQVGEKLQDIKTESLKGYNSSQISAAYSWILQKYIKRRNSKPSKIKTQRVLHFAERMLITPEAYGYLIELYTIGVLDQMHVESIIEKAMFHAPEKITLDKVKELVSQQLFEETQRHFVNYMLSGNEAIN